MTDSYETEPSRPADSARAEEGVGEKIRPYSRLALVVAGLAAVVALLSVLSGFGSRWGLWHFRTGFTLLEWAAYGAVAVMVLALPALWFARPGGSRRGFPLALLALLVSLPVFLVPWTWQNRVAEVPPIHDISTDLEDPPEFQAVAPLREDAPNPVEHPGEEVAQLQREAYPDIQPLILDEPLEASSHRALDVAAELGWQVVAFDPPGGRLEATDRTFWFGFRDDVVVRVTETEEGTRVDIRSKSRVGRSDVGTNARRIRSFLDRLARL